MTPGSPSENLIFELLWGSQSRNSRAGRPVKSVCSPADPHSDPSRYPPSESTVTAAARGKRYSVGTNRPSRKTYPAAISGSTSSASSRWAEWAPGWPRPCWRSTETLQTHTEIYTSHNMIRTFHTCCCSFVLRRGAETNINVNICSDRFTCRRSVFTKQTW